MKRQMMILALAIVAAPAFAQSTWQTQRVAPTGFGTPQQPYQQPYEPPPRPAEPYVNPYTNQRSAPDAWSKPTDPGRGLDLRYQGQEQRRTPR